VGSGGFGIVFKAKFRGETVAVKKIHAHALSNASSIAEFQSEVAVLCTLQHPNILRFVGACTMPPNLMIITEFMSRGTLFDVLHQSQMRVPWSMRKKFAMDTCRGMRYLHDSKLLHRDLKSSNLMLDKDFNCKVGDFGLTRLSRGAAAAQMTGQCGTFQYMAVEVLTSKPYSEKADVFSFGILLWEMVARKLPYFGMQPMQVGMAVVQQGMRPPIPPKCPAPLVKLMKACWDSDPNVRPSFAQLVQALEAMPE
ncbi:Serine/threonine protein kinase (fragment), partial [Chondrus crispus]